MNDLTREQKGLRAEEILKDPVFTEVIETARASIVAQWHLTDLNDVSTRENLFMQGRGLDEVIRGLRSLVGDWTVEKKNLKRKRRK
jgi:hypothetical protein